MNKVLKGFLIATLAISSASAKDFVAPKTNLSDIRLVSDNSPYYTMFHKMKAAKNDTLIGGNIDATGFYAHSVNSPNFGKNFGVNGTNQVKVIGTTNPDILANISSSHPNVLGALLVHESALGTGASASEIAGTFDFQPKQTAWGVTLNYFQRLDKVLDGLYVGAKVPFAHYKNDLGVSIKNETKITNEKVNVSVMDALQGKTLSRDSAENAQEALKYGKLCSDTKTGLGDIELFAGWNFLEGKKYHAGVNAGVVFPTAGDANPEARWAARTGEGKWGIRLGADASALLWEDEDQSLTVNASVLYKYLLSGTEKRMLGLKTLRHYDANAQKVELLRDPIWSEYYLVGTKGSAGLQPLANVSTLDVKVKGRNMLEGQLAFAYTNGGFTLDLGYNLLWKEREHLSLKGLCGDTCSTSTWDNKYAVANKQYDADEEFAVGNSLTGIGSLDEAEAYLTTEDLNLKGAAANSQLVHKVFAGVGYQTTTWEYPVFVKAGVAYELPSNKRDALEGYSVYVGGGFSF